MRSTISAAKPGPSSLIVMLTVLGGPLRENFHPLVREIDCILDQIAEAVADRRIAGTGGFRGRGSAAASR